MNFFNKSRDYLNKIRWFSLSPATFRTDRNKISIFNNLFFLINLMKIILVTFIEFIHSLLIKFYYLFLRRFEVDNVNIKKNYNKCFIVANGQSLKDLDLKKIKNADIFVCNYFCFSQASKKVIPSFYTLTDGSFFNWQESYNLKSKTKKSAIKKNRYILSQILKQTSKKTKFLIPSGFKKGLQTLDVIPNKRVNYFNELPYPIEEFLPNKLDINYGIPFGFNVFISNLCLAMALKYKKIYLVGADQDHYLTEKYSFNQNLKNFQLKRYWIKHKIDKYQLINSNKNILGFWSMYRSFKAFENILIYAKKNNIEIANCSTRGILDIFKYKKFEKAVNEKN